MTTYTNKHSAVVAMLKQAIDNHGYNMTDLEQKTGITRSQLYRWINGDAKNIQQKSFQAVAHNLGYVIRKQKQSFRTFAISNSRKRFIRSIAMGFYDYC
jgi:transcriptional regulator with XRE-family HTH domain